MQGKKYYSEKLFTSFQLSERVPDDNFYRRLKEALDLSFMRELTKSYYGECGQKCRKALAGIFWSNAVDSKPISAI